MKRTFRIGGREVEFVPEEPGVLLIMLIVFMMLLCAPSVEPGGNTSPPGDEHSQTAASH